MDAEQIKSVLIGVAVGDALGVPVEFVSRNSLRANPVENMREYGSHTVPAGTFSDDTSLTLCLAEALTQDFDLKTIARNFEKWYDEAYWTATGEVFDIGIATQNALSRLAKGIPPELAGGTEESSNGNGSLMRIAPLAFYLRHKPIMARFTITRLVSSITHGHVRSVISCFYYVEFLIGLLSGKDKFLVYQSLQSKITDLLNDQKIVPTEIEKFHRLLKQDIHELNENEISSSGYVLHTLEASIWCLLTTHSFKDAVLKAVNLGEDTDTTGAVTGGLAGALYGFENIPEEWISVLARKEDIAGLAFRLGEKLNNME